VSSHGSIASLATYWLPLENCRWTSSHVRWRICSGKGEWHPTDGLCYKYNSHPITGWLKVFIIKIPELEPKTTIDSVEKGHYPMSCCVGKKHEWETSFTIGLWNRTGNVNQFNFKGLCYTLFTFPNYNDSIVLNFHCPLYRYYKFQVFRND
jgi:hypothetical protein